MMINHKLPFAILAIVSAFFTGILHAQVKDSIPIEKIDSISNAKPVDANDLSPAKFRKETNSGAILKRTGRPFDLEDNITAYTFDSLWLAELYNTNQYFLEMQAELSENQKDTLIYTDLNTDTLKARLARLDAKTPFNIAYNPSLERVIKRFLTHKRPLMEKMLSLSQFYFPMFEQELDNQNLPLELKYLSIVESALNPRAKSPVGAKGLWQFMYATGKMHGLEVSNYVDDRSDPLASTKAAGEYITQLYGIFNDWDLALAAYNSGPGNVNKAIRRSGGYTNFWNIRMFLPRETAGYLPSFLATMYIFEYAGEHGLSPKKVPRPYFSTDTVWIKNTVTFEQLSKTLDISISELEVLNPSYKLNVIPKIEGKQYALRLPLKHLGKFVTHEKVIYAYAKAQLDSLEKPLPKLVTNEGRVRYRVKNGDYLGKIAERYGVGVSQLKRWNGLRGDNLRIGQRLTIYPRKPVATAEDKAVESKPTNPIVLPNDPKKIHVVEEGDSLWTISKKYPGISIENLKIWNGLTGNRLKPGTKLRLCDCSS